MTRLTYTAPRSGAKLPIRLRGDRRRPGHLFLIAGSLAASLTQQQAIDLANAIADELEGNRP